MTEEEAIKLLKENYIEHYYYDDSTLTEATLTVLNLIQKQQEEIEMYKDIKRIAETQVTELADFISYKGKLEQKDKIIDLMADGLANYVMYYEYDKCRVPNMIKAKAEEIKEYFEKKAEEN